MYVLIVVFIFCVSFALISESVTTYNPKTIAELKVKYEGWIGKVAQLETDYQWSLIARSEIDKKAKNPKSVIRALLALGKNIEWIFLIKDSFVDSNDAKCDDELEDYINSSTIEIAINSHLCNIEFLREFLLKIKWINPNWEKDESEISDIYRLLNNQKYIYKDYIWLKQIFEILLYSVWVLISIILVTLTIRVILFYIIFWNAFIKE